MTTQSSPVTPSQRSLSPETWSRFARTPLRDNDPRQIGDYRLTARLGAGGMGVVYLGVAANGRLVAVKILRPEYADDPEFQARFGRELSVLPLVRGERIVRVIEVGADTTGPFLATEYAAGPTLAASVETAGPLGPHGMSTLATGLAEALADIHAAGVVHRDLKPSNVILAGDGPKVIDFGIAQVLDSVPLTRTGVTVGSVGYIAPEQIEGQAGPATDIFAWAATLAYAASGQPPFGTGEPYAVMYRILNLEPDLSAVSDSLRPMVEAALAKDPRNRPAAHEIVSQLTAGPDAVAGPPPVPGVPGVSGVHAPATVPAAPLRPPAPGQAVERGLRAGRRRMRIVVPAVLLAAVTALALVVLAGRHSPQGGHATQQGTTSAGGLDGSAFGVYPGQQGRGVYQTITRTASYGSTIVTTGAQVSDGVVRQQFLFSPDGGRSWRVAPVRAASGGQAPLGYQATRVAGGPRGWVAISTASPAAIWTSPDGRSWTLAATHGLPAQAGDSVWVLTSTAHGFLAAGQGAHGQAVIWTSADGVTWQRSAAGQLGLTDQGRTLASVSWATSYKDVTVISGQFGNGQFATWTSIDGGTAWTPATVPVTGGAQNTISGLAADGSGLIAVRPGRAGDALAYFSANGLNWQYAATIGAAGALQASAVRGSADGFAVTGADAAGNYVAYASTGTGTSWRPAGSLGSVASYQSGPSGTVGAGGTVVVAGSAAPSRTGQRAVLLRATAAGTIQPVPLTSIPGAVVPEVTVTSMATDGAQQVAVGSADGYPAIWYRTGGGRWRLVSSPSLAAPAGQTATALTAMTSVAHGQDGWLAVGLPGPVVLISANGTTWHPAAGSIAHDLSGVGGLAVAAGPGGYVITGKEVEPNGECAAYVFHSANLASWTRARDVNDTSGSSQIVQVTAAGNGFVSAGSHNGQPALWVTADGTSWTTIVLPGPAGTTGVLQQVAARGDRIVAVGTQTRAGATSPLAAVSGDGGRTFGPVTFGMAGTDLGVTALAADAGGFTAVVQSGVPGQQVVAAWSSAGGTSWAAGRVSGLPGGGSDQVNALAVAGGRVTGIGVSSTSVSQQPVVVGVPGR